MIVGIVAKFGDPGPSAKVVLYCTNTMSGAVSPSTRARPSTMPVSTPEIEVGSTTLKIVRHLETPSA